MATIKFSGELKNRDRLSTTVDKGLLKALRELSDDTMVPLSRLADEMVEDLLVKRGIPYEWYDPSRKPKRK